MILEIAMPVVLAKFLHAVIFLFADHPVLCWPQTAHESNRELCQIAELDTLKASKQLKRWVDQGLLVSNQTTGTKNRIYFKPDTEGGDDNHNLDLLAKASESKSEK